MTTLPIPSALPAEYAERARDDSHCHAVRPSADALQASLYRLREEIDAGNRIIREQARRIDELTAMLKLDNEGAGK